MSQGKVRGTGVLIFSGPAVFTAVIKGVFSAFGLKEDYPGNGRAYVRVNSEDSNTGWEVIAKNLLGAFDLEPAVSDDGMGSDWSVSIAELKSKLAGTLTREGEEFLDDLVARIDTDCSIAEAFELAYVLQDGHNLVGMEFEGAYTHSKMVLGEFGGFGVFCGPGNQLVMGTGEAVRLGEMVGHALQDKRPDSFELMARQIEHMVLDGVRNAAKREELRRKLAEHFAS